MSNWTQSLEVKGKSLSTPPRPRAVPSADPRWSWVLLVCLSFCTTPSPRGARGSAFFPGEEGRARVSPWPSSSELAGNQSSCLSRRAGGPHCAGRWGVYYAACALLGRMCDRVCYNSNVSQCKRPDTRGRGQSLVPFHPCTTGSTVCLCLGDGWKDRT